MTEIVFCLTYGYMLGIVFSILFEPGEKWIRPGYWIGGLGAAAALALLRALGKRGAIYRRTALGVLFFSTMLVGYGRYVDRQQIPRFDPDDTERPVHLRALMEAFPDTVPFRSVTRIVGTIAAEPEYFPPPEPGRPGYINLVVEPSEFEAEPLPPPRAGDTVSREGMTPGRVWRVNEGAIQVRISPKQDFQRRDAEFERYYKILVDPEAYGAKIRLVVSIQEPQPAANPGLYDAEAFLSDKDIYGQAFISRWDDRFPPIEEVDTTVRGFVLTEWALEIKKSLLTEMKRTVPFPESAFLAGVTLGARTGLSGVRCTYEGEGPSPESGEPDIRHAVLDEFRWSGTSHVLAVSGLHVSIIALALFGFFTGLRIPTRIFAPMIVFCLFLFALLVGAPPSAMRAAIMNSLVLMTYVYGKKSFQTSVILSVSVAAILILWNNPKWIFQPSFALSFIAIYSLGLLTEPADRALVYLPGYTRLPAWTRSFVSAQFAIQVGMMGPLSAYYFTRMSTAGPFANFLAIPLIGLIVPLGLIAAGIGCIPIPGAEQVALLLNAGNYLGIKLFLWSAHISTVYFPFPFVKTLTPEMLFAYFITVFGLFAFHPQWLPPLRIDLYDIRHGIVSGAERARKIGLWSGAAILYLAVVAYCFFPPAPDPHLRVRFLSVGYGNSIHIQTPGGRNLLIDAGPAVPGGWDVGERVIASYLLKQRVDSLEALILTAPSPEEIGGAARILQIFPTRRFLAPFDPAELPDDAAGAETAVAAWLAGTNPRANEPSSDLLATQVHLDRLRETLLGAGSPLERFLRRLEHFLTAPGASLATPATPERWKIARGDVLAEEAGPGGVFRITALYPSPKPGAYAGPEGRTAVLRIEYGKKAFLIPSDLTRKGMEELLHLDPDLLKADVVLVPSHGSQIAHSPLFLQGLALTAPVRDTATRYAILTYGFARDLSAPGGGGRGRTERSQDRISPFPHRARFSRVLEEEANATREGWEKAGWRVLSTDDRGAILFESDGQELRMTHQITAGFEEEAEAAGAAALREYN